MTHSTPSPDDHTAGLAAALDAAKRGLPVMPAKAKDADCDGKHPALSYAHLRGLDHLRDPGWIRGVGDWSHGVCVLLQGDSYVTDADTPEAAASMRSWSARTLRVATRKGCHAHWRLPPGVRLRQGAKCEIAGHLLDIKGESKKGGPTIAHWWGPPEPDRDDASAPWSAPKHVEHDVPVAVMPRWLIRTIGPPSHDDGEGCEQDEPTVEQAAVWEHTYSGSHRAFGTIKHLATIRELGEIIAEHDRSSTNSLHHAACQIGRMIPCGLVRFTEALDLLVNTYTGEYKNIDRSTRRGLMFGAASQEAALTEMWDGHHE